MIEHPNAVPMRRTSPVRFLFLLAAAGIATVGIERRTGAAEPPRRIVFLVSEDPNNYEAHRTVPPFAAELGRSHGFRVTVLKGEGERNAYRFPDLHILSETDLLVVFCRRLALPLEQMSAIKQYLQAGKPLVGIRTANHAFTLRETISEGFQDWPEFVSNILGCENRGYGPTTPGTNVAVAQGAAEHPVVRGVVPAAWHSKGNVYHVAPLLDPKAVVLVHGEVQGKLEPIAWTRTAGASRVFYTSLGHPDDFDRQPFRTLLVNGILWALNDSEND